MENRKPASEYNPEKRTAGDYEIKQSVKFGGAEYIVGEDKNAALDEKYMTCIVKSSSLLGIAEYTDETAGGDYLEIIGIFTERIAEKAREYAAERDKFGVSKEPLTAADCIENGLNESISGKVVVLKPDALCPEFRTAVYQIVLAKSGFGCEPDSRGTAVYCENLFTGENEKYSRYNIAGVLKPELLPERAKKRLAEITNPAAEKTSMLKELNETKAGISERNTQKVKNKRERKEIQRR
jgi:hypothetical protein